MNIKSFVYRKHMTIMKNQVNDLFTGLSGPAGWNQEFEQATLSASVAVAPKMPIAYERRIESIFSASYSSLKWQQSLYSGGSVNPDVKASQQRRQKE